MPRAPTSLSLSPGILSQCRPLSVLESEMTSEMGSELEFPKTWSCQLRNAQRGWGTPYGHGHDKVGGPLVEPAYPRHRQGGNVRDECLYDEDDGNDGKLGQLLGRQLGGELGKD